MKIILNGATAGTNFGDFLFARMFNDKIAEKIGLENVYWYDSRYALSDFYKTRLKYDKKYKLKDINALVYTAGGYFCGNDTCLKHRIIRVLSYFVIGLRCISRNIPYGIFAVEVGNVKSVWLRFIEKKILKNAKIVIVRNHESLDVVKSYGIDNAILTADAVFAMENHWFENENVSDELSSCNTKKLFLHIATNADIKSKIKNNIIPGLNKFLKHHSEYSVVLGMDQYTEEQKKILDDVAEKIECDNIIYTYYNDPFALCKVLDNMDCIITPKLHVGIVGARLSKSVISFSGHTEKIARLYKQLGVPERSFALEKCNESIVNDMLEKYHSIPIIVPEEITAIANNTFALLDEFIDKVERGKI